VEDVVGKGVGEEARLAPGEAGEGDGRAGGVGVEVVEPEAEGGGVALEAALTAGLASNETGDEVLGGGGVEEEDEGPELGGVPPMLEGVEVALGCAGAGSFAAPSAALRAGPGPFDVAQDRHGGASLQGLSHPPALQ
jgi:hypothetical protein